MTNLPLPRILRRRGDPEYPTFLELFFDLVYIFMLSRLAERLGNDLSLRNALQTAVLLLAAWWIWVLTAWVTDLFSPRLPVIQALVLLLMLGTLVMAIAVPKAFGSHGWIFVAAYYAMAVARGAMLIPRTRVNRDIQARHVRVAFWFGVSATPWIAGLFTEGTARLVLWSIAVAIDIGAAWIGWPTPRFGATQPASQIFTGAHLAERHREIFIIGLGELVLSAGLGLAGHRFTADRVAACALAFTSVVLLFQLYFHRVRQLLGPQMLAVVERVRSSTYTSYAHLVMVGGVVLMSASVSLVIERPFGETTPGWTAALLGGPALFLIGAVLFDLVATRRPLWSRLAALGALAAVGPAASLLPPIAIMLVANLVLLITLVIELGVWSRQLAGAPLPID
ncbi:low temperature requirement protein A [Micromonospora sp. NPDC050417]|uniref:low temperature requirement protein A n=1 Tax=Micromonospora sp. NPDC050417 TaxID=3364280 RepID=UPI003787EAF3